jgi:hypothetical protein
MQTKDIYTRSTAFKSSEARCGFQTRIYEALEHATRAQQQQQHKSNKYKPTEANIFTDGGRSGGATICAPQTITSNARNHSINIQRTQSQKKHCWRWHRLGRCKIANSRVGAHLGSVNLWLFIFIVNPH